jgi:hypothetical protein
MNKTSKTVIALLGMLSVMFAAAPSYAACPQPGGFEYESKCWYATAMGESCSTRCTGLGLTAIPGACQIVNSAAACKAVLDGLSLPPVGENPVESSTLPMNGSSILADPRAYMPDLTSTIDMFVHVPRQRLSN